MSNTFGRRFCFTTFGESHGRAIGCVVDGVPAGLSIDEVFIQSELDRRKPGQNKFATARKEGDKVEILSGVFEGKSTGTPIAMVIFNENQKSGDYENVKNLFRPGHADFTYFHKYGIRDYRGGGRSSARETAARVAAGAVAKLLLNALHVKVQSGICAIGGIEAQSYDFERVSHSEIYALDASVEEAQKEKILEAKNAHDSIGGVALVQIVGAPIGLGEPMYYKLDALLADAMMGINGVKGVEIGEGFHASGLKGSQNNDAITQSGFVSNHSGGILGGMSNGDVVTCKVYFKPTPSIFLSQETIDTEGHALTCNLKGRHDPCIAVRGSVVAESMAALVIADLLLLNLGTSMEHLKQIYM
ncbi:chorismate synthase [Sulfurospirillum deleyianum]|uniref:Chorismate synthase n=1 Tax=Sulfurospirillum deleyianum (strain ATCC 51133 / DSM 6946 / 5175) TaxID=525898 RepID=D1B4G9_SULD5|nr:chorismate synthase [Sulfurospirillum deleyianum]ACZ12989.1 chorismate synthase [Sulfurospirillum deleyianum DSM 6946]